MNQLFVAVRAGCRGVGQLILDALELLHEALIGLAAEAAQCGGLVQTDRCEMMRVNVAVSDALVVGQDDGAVLASTSAIVRQ